MDLLVHLRAGYFMENLYGGIGMIKGMGINGSPMTGDLKIPQIATKDIAAHAAARMIGKDFIGKVVQELLGSRLSQSMAAGFVEMHKGFNEGTLGKAERNASNTTPTTIEEFAKEFALAYQA